MAADDRDVKDLFDRAINAEPFGAGPFGQINDLDAAPWFAVGVFQLLIERQPFKSGYYGDPSLSKYTFINGYNVTNASIGYRSGHGWEVALFARNLFGANYIQNLTIQAGNSGLVLGNPNDPRMIGVTVTLRQ